MKYFGITFQNELIRMFHRKKLVTGMAVAAFIPMVVVLAKILALGWSTTFVYREDLFRLALSLYTPLILPLFSIVLTADAFIEEQSRGSLKTTLLLPDSRSGHFWAKLAGAFAGTAGMLLSLWFFSAVFSLALPSRGGWPISLGFGLLQGLASLLPILVVIGFSVLASQFIKSGSGMVLALIGLAIVMKLIPLWLGGLNGILPTAWLGFGANIAALQPVSVLHATAGMLLWSVFTCGLAIMRFERKMI